jgi:hypothetical protein
MNWQRPDARCAAKCASGIDALSTTAGSATLRAWHLARPRSRGRSVVAGSARQRMKVRTRYVG